MTPGVQQFEVIEIEGDSARIQATCEAPGTYPFSLRLTDLTPWTD
ncbi:hypothetical protein ACWEVD_00630 [Nocardia thailandica]